MIHLLLLTGAAGASSSASIEEKSVGGVATGSSVEIGAPGRALAAGKCCKRAAKHKRKKLQLKMKWETCKKAADATPTCETCETCETCATVETCGEPGEGKKFMFADVTASTACGDLCATACFEDKTCGDPEDGMTFKDDVTAETACGTTCETTCFEDKTCGDPDPGKQFKDDVTAETACGTTCETTCFEDFEKKEDGEACAAGYECISGICDDKCMGSGERCLTPEEGCF